MQKKADIELRRALMSAARNMVAACVVATQNACDENASEEQAEGNFRHNLRQAYRTHILRLDLPGHSSVLDLPDQAFGRIFAALHYELQGIYEKWRVFLSADPTLINKTSISNRSAAEAASAGARCVARFAELFDELDKVRESNYVRAVQLAADVRRNIEARGNSPFAGRTVVVLKTGWREINIAVFVKDAEPVCAGGESTHPTYAGMGPVFPDYKQWGDFLGMVHRHFGVNAQVESRGMEAGRIVLPCPPCCKIENLS